MKLETAGYDRLWACFAGAPARLQDRVVALVGSREVEVGYGWSEDLPDDLRRWHSPALIEGMVLLAEATTPCAREADDNLHELLDARTILIAGQAIESVGRGLRSSAAVPLGT
ncbi:MAG: hypothetical protein LCH87_11075 [Actinobacteria bacterium]|nr:hypothetical protein [Actinomycetota bacterium]